MAPQTNDDPFDDLLTLEDTLYTTAHDQGVADGARAGRIEGRIFGLEKGFEKFAALGELHGRGSVWGARIPTPTSSSANASPDSSAQSTATAPSTQNATATPHPLPTLPNQSTRLQSNITLLYHLTDPLTFSTSNNETSVADFDDRSKRAGAKAKVIERIIGESSVSTANMSSTAVEPERGNTSGKSSEKGRNVRLEGEGKRRGKKGDDSIEDFGGSRLIG